MIGWLVKMLTGAGFAGVAGPWILLAGVLAIGAAGGVAGNEIRVVLDAPVIAGLKTDVANERVETAQEQVRTQQCVATHEKGRADGDDQVIAGMLANAKAAAGVLDGLAKKAAARKQSLDQLLKEIANAPPSKVCAGSAAELAYRRSLQPRSPAVPAAAP